MIARSVQIHFSVSKSCVCIISNFNFNAIFPNPMHSVTLYTLYTFKCLAQQYVMHLNHYAYINSREQKAKEKNNHTFAGSIYPYLLLLLVPSIPLYMSLLLDLRRLFHGGSPFQQYSLKLSFQYPAFDVFSTRLLLGITVTSVCCISGWMKWLPLSLAELSHSYYESATGHTYFHRKLRFV